MKQARLLLFAFVLLIVGTVVAVKWPRAEKARLTARDLPTVSVQPASFDVTLAVTGVVDAAKSIPVINEATRTQIAWMLTDGMAVKPGDVIMRLNDTELKKRVTDFERQDAEATAKDRNDAVDGEKRIQNAKSALEKAKDDLKLNQVQNKAALEKAQAEIDFMQKEVELAQGQLDKRKRLSDEKLMPLRDLEQAQDELRAKQFGLEKAKRGLNQAAEDAKANESAKQLAIRKAELEIASSESALAQSKAEAVRSQQVRTVQLEEARDQLLNTVVTAPSAGLLLMDRMWDMDGLRPIRLGDSVHEGQRLASIIDPSQMRVKCDINEGDIERVKVGQQAVVQVAAIGGRPLKGLVKSIDNLARERGWWEGGTPGKQVFSAIIMLTDVDRRLRPGMGGAVQISLEKASRGLAVPVESLFEKQGKSYVYKLDTSGYRAVPVKVIDRNEMTAAVEGALKSGDKVSRERPPADLVIETKERRA